MILARNVDLPALGKPIIPTSAISFNSSLIQRSWPLLPSSAKRGAWLVGDLKWALPLPFLPPLAILIDSSNSFKSLITRPVFRSFTSVPLGILMIKSFPSLPFLLLFFPFPPSSAMNFTFDVMSSSVSTFSFTCRMTLPPLPPSPPLGPPRGTYFSGGSLRRHPHHCSLLQKPLLHL